MTHWGGVHECDVVDKERLTCFRDRLGRWKECAVGRDAHSIVSQISALLWDDTVFRTFNEARRLHVEARDPSTGYFGTVIELLDKNFMDAQVMAIRRLTDRHNPNPGRTVISFPTVIAEIVESQSLYTRENYVCYDATPYSESAAENEEAIARVRMRHRKYDILAECSDSRRSRQDPITPTFLAELKKDHSAFQEIKAYANKYLAHAADPANRQEAEDVLNKVSLRAFDACYRDILQMASVVGLLVDEFICCKPPVPSFNPLKDWDKSLVTSVQLRELRKYWSDRVSEINRWTEEVKSKMSE